MYGLLRPGGKIFLREPVKESHGIPADEIDKLIEVAGFIKTSGIEKKKRFMGEAYTACYVKASNIRFFLG
jgi:hypothetical protein